MSQSGFRNPSPEEKLLRIIRSKGDPSGPSATVASESGAAMQKKDSMPFPTKNYIASDAKFFSFIPARLLEALNIFLIVMACIGIFSILFLIYKPLPQANTETASVRPAIFSEAVSQAKSEDKEEDPMPQLSASASGGLFGPYSRNNDSLARSGMSQESRDISSRLNLLGVVAGEKSQAIIEDSKTSKTYFLSVGQALPDGWVVEEISKDRVRLDFNGEKIELSL
jgi:hypothetical protein